MLLLAAPPGCASSKAKPSAKPAAAAVPDTTATVDFGRLRDEYGDRDDFDALCVKGRPLQQFVELINGQRYAEALAISQPWSVQCPVDIDARFVNAVALVELGREGESAEDVRWYKGLVDSVMASGDGRTPDTAFVVISIEEEYAILRVLRLRPLSQKLSDEGIDAVTVEGEGGTGTIYFDPQAYFRRRERQQKQTP